MVSQQTYWIRELLFVIIAFIHQIGGIEYIVMAPSHDLKQYGYRLYFPFSMPELT